MLPVPAEGLHNCAKDSSGLTFSCLENKHIFMNDTILAQILYFAVFNSLLHESE